MKENTTKRIVGLVVAVALIALTAVLPTPEGVTREALLSLGVFAAALSLWICNTFPMSVAAFGLMMTMPLLGILPLNDVFAQFGGTAFFFAIATFAVSIALENTSVPLRVCHALTSRTKSSPTKLVIAMMFACGIVSAFMSNLATCIIFLSISHGLLEANGAEPGKSNLGKCLMIGVPAASGIGGLMTPAGTPGNALIIGLLESEANISITFLQWIGLFAPIGLLAILLASVWITRVYKPEQITDAAITDLETRLSEVGSKLTDVEKRTLIIIGLMVVCWLLGTWVPAFNVTIVAVFGMVAMFLPGVGVLEWKDTAARINWDLAFTIGSVGVLIGGMSSTGIMTWIVNSLLSGIGGMNLILAFLLMGVVVCVIRAFIPTAPAIVAMFGPPLLALAPILGATPTAMLYLPAMWACAPMLLWIEPIYLFSYGWGYYKPLDVLKFGVVPSALLIIVMAFTPMYCALFGL